MRQPLQVPPGVGRWLNFAERLDPVALDADLANDFTVGMFQLPDVSVLREVVRALRSDSPRALPPQRERFQVEHAAAVCSTADAR